MEEAAINDATASHAEEKSEAPPSESNSYNRKNNIKLSNKYLFPGQFYNIIFNFGKNELQNVYCIQRPYKGKIIRLDVFWVI